MTSVAILINYTKSAVTCFTFLFWPIYSSWLVLHASIHVDALVFFFEQTWML
jgi:hypothetical protein